MKAFLFLVLILAFSNLTIAQQEQSSDTSLTNSGNKKSLAVRYQGFVETGYSWGLGQWGQSVYRLNFINAVRLNNYSIGVGLGCGGFPDFETIDLNSKTDTAMITKFQIPVYLDNRMFFSQKKILKFLSFGIGFSMVGYDGSFLNTEIHFPLFMNAETGILWPINERISLAFGIYYESLNIMYKGQHPQNGPYGNYHYSYVFIERSRSLGITTGISF